LQSYIYKEMITLEKLDFLIDYLLKENKEIKVEKMDTNLRFPLLKIIKAHHLV